MKGIIFKIFYRDEEAPPNANGEAKWRSKWIIFESKDDHLLWFKNPLRENKIESLPLNRIIRMEEKTEKELNNILLGY